jgi:hypothetical protein
MYQVLMQDLCSSSTMSARNLRLDILAAAGVLNLVCGEIAELAEYFQAFFAVSLESASVAFVFAS